MLYIWLQLKQKEFIKLGYDQVTASDLLEYCTNLRWKNNQPKYYFELVNNIMKITPNDYFNYASLDAQVYSVEPLSKMKIDDLLV